MARFIFTLPDELAARIEAYRRDEGHKATAEAVRELIERGLTGHRGLIYQAKEDGSVERLSPPKPQVRQVAQKVEKAAPGVRVAVDVPVARGKLVEPKR